MNSIPTAVPVTRTTSRKRRVSGTGSGSRKSQLGDHFQPPAAPEVPRAPPVSYKEPYVSNGTSPSAGNPTSFAARARGYAAEPEIVSAEISPELEPNSQYASQSRRNNVNTSSKSGNPERIDQPQESTSRRPSKTMEGVQIQQSAAAKVPRQHRVPDVIRDQPATAVPVSESQSTPTTLPARSSTRRSSVGAPDPRKEWAPDRSPLQKLEVKLNDISKEEKRARVEKAEKKLRERLAEEERRRQEQEGQPGASRGHDTTASGPMSGTEPVLSEKVPKAEPRHSEKRSRNRMATPNYVEDIDQQQLERLQQPSNQKATPFSARSIMQGNVRTSQKASSDEIPPQPQSARGVRFQSGNDGAEDNKNLDLQDGNGPTQSQNRRNSDAQGVRTQQISRQDEPAKSSRHAKEVPSQQQALYSSKAQGSGEAGDTTAYGGAADPVPKNSVRARNHAIEYEVPPQTAGGIEARQKVGFGGDPAGALPAPAQRHKHHLSKILHHGHASMPTQTFMSEKQPRHLSEWRQGGIARLTAADLDSTPVGSNEQKAWWEGGNSRTQGTTARAVEQPGSTGAYPQNSGIHPPTRKNCRVFCYSM